MDKPKNNNLLIIIAVVGAIGGGIYAFAYLSGQFKENSTNAEKERQEIKSVDLVQQGQIDAVQEQAVRTEEQLKALDKNVEKLDKNMQEGFKRIEDKLDK